MNNKLLTILPAILLLMCLGVSYQSHGQGCIAVERNGVAAVEAENFVKQTKTSKRQWYFQDGTKNTPKPDPDPSHHGSASGGGYLEILPDTRVTHGDPLVNGESFSNTPGVVAIIDYRVRFSSPGKYFVWVRTYSTGSEDNGIHVGLNGSWPASGQRMQWCAGKNQWTWESKQRTGANHCGEPQLIFLNIPSAGVHTISFSMREDGFEFDKFVLSKAYTKPTGNGPAQILEGCQGGGQTVANGTYTIESPTSGQRLMTSAAINHIAKMANASGSANQKWAIAHRGNNIYSVKNIATNRFLEVPYARCINNETVATYTEVLGDHQLWKIEANGNGVFALKPAHCLSRALDRTAGALNANGQIYDFSTGNGNQKWRLSASANRSAQPALEAMDASVAIYPNPVEDMVHITGANPGDHITILNLLGKVVMEQNASSIDAAIEVSGLKPGQYIVSVAGKTKLKFIKK